MEQVILLYLAKSSILLLVFYVAYHFFLSATTFHSLNRLYLLSGVLISFTIPFFHFPIKDSSTLNTFILPIITISDIHVFQTNPASFSYVNICIDIYLTGIAFLGLRLGHYLIQLITVLRKSNHQKSGKLNISYSKVQNAFSFFWYIIIPKNLSGAEAAIILQHEALHAKKWHSLDVLIIEMAKIIFWFHPVIYLLKHELTKQHEFEVDRLLTSKDIQIKQYGNLLLQQTQNIPVQLSLVNNFNHSLIKNRIQMMTKEKSKNINLLRYLAILPVIAITCGLVACEKMAEKTSMAKKTEKTVVIQDKNSNAFTIVEEMPKFQNGENDLLMYIGNNIKYPESAKTNHVEGVVVIEFVVEKDGSLSNHKILRDIGGGCGEEALRVVQSMPNWKPGEENGQAVRVSYKLPVKFKLDSTVK